MKRHKAEQSTAEEETGAASDVRDGEEALRHPSVTSTSTGSGGSSCSSPSTETTALTLSTESRQLTSSSDKAATKSATAGQAGTHPRLSTATLSSGSMADYSADDEMSISARTAALAESLSRGPDSQAAGSLETSSSGTGAAAMETAAGGAEAQRTLSKVTFPPGSPDDDCFLPPGATTLSKTALAQSETNPDQSEATQPPTSQEPQSPMDVSGSEGTSSAEFSFDLSASSGLPSTGASAESYPQSTASAPRKSPESADTLGDVSDVNASSDPFDDPSASDEDTSVGRDPAKPAPVKRRRPHHRRHVEVPDRDRSTVSLASERFRLPLDSFDVVRMVVSDCGKRRCI